MTALRQRLRETADPFRAVAANQAIRRLELAYAGASSVQWAGSVAIIVYGFQRAGATAVAIQVLSRMIPSAIVAPFASTFADRHDKVRVMIGSDLVRFVISAACAVAVGVEAALAIVFTLSALNGVVDRAFEPARAAVTPSLARTPQELTAANVVSSSIESITMFVGPALGGLLLAATSFEVVIACVAAGFLWSALLLRGIRARPTPAEPSAEPAGMVREAAEGARAIARDRRLMLLIGFVAAQLFVYGLLTVLIVAMALDLLDMGRAGVGFLQGALGIGGIVGAIATASLVGARRLAPSFVLGQLWWGLPLAAIAVIPEPAAAVALLGVVGVANTFVDVSGLTLLQRIAPEDVLGRVFGMLESCVLVAMAAGSALAPALIDGLGVKATLLIAGAILPTLVVVFSRALLRIDAAGSETIPARELTLLRAVPMFAPLRPVTLEQLAAHMTTVTASAGDEVFAQGDRGDRFYVIAAGQVEVRVDGRLVRVEGPGDWFGEIALLRDTPRTATVTALTQVDLRALDREEFIGVVSGHPRSAEAADAVVAARLAAAQPAVATL
jgi:MFS family permease